MQYAFALMQKENQINMKNNKKINYWMISTLIFALLSAGIFGVYIRGKDTKKKQEISTGQIMPTVTITNIIPTTVLRVTAKPTLPQANIPSNWKRYDSKVLGITFYYPQDLVVSEDSGKFPGIGLTKPDSPVRWNIIEFDNYDGGSRRLWYLNNHPEFSQEDRDNLKYTEYQTGNYSGLLVTYTGTNYGWNDILLIPRGKKMIAVSADDQRFFQSIRL